MSATGRGVIAIAMLALLAVAWRAQYALQYGPWPVAQAAMLLAAAAVALCAGWIFLGGIRAHGWAPPGAREWVTAAAVCGLGIAFRVVHFSTVPGGLNHDAAFNGMYALHVLQGAPYTPYVAAAWGRETLFMYLCAALVWMFGNVPESIQIAATLVAVATLPLLYLFVRALWGPRVALVALALLAVSGWHNVFSRVGWRMIMVPPCTLIAMIGLWHGLERGRWRAWALAGVGMALAIYTYDAGRIVPPMVLALLALFSVLDRHNWTARLRGGLVTLAVFFAAGGPMLWYAAVHFEQFKARASHLAEQEHLGIVPNTISAAAMFNYRGNGNDFFVEEPLLEPLTGALFVFALLVIAITLVAGIRRRPTSVTPAGDTRASLFVLVGFVIGLLPGILATPNGNRCIAALPFVYAILARGLVGFADVFAGALLGGAAARKLAVAVIAAVIAIGGIETYREFLGAQRRAMIGFSPPATAAGQYLRGFGEEYSRYVVSEDWPDYTLAYLSYNGGGTPLENQYVMGRTLAEIEDRINRYGRKGLVFVMDQKGAGRAALEQLQRLFANPRIEPITAASLGGAQIGTALIVEPQGAARTKLWSNVTRTLAAGGDAPAASLRCFDPIGDKSGVSARLQLMLPAPGTPRPIGEVAWFARCPSNSAGKPPLAVGIGVHGIELRADRSVVLRSWSALDAGRWYDVVLQLGADGSVRAAVDGEWVEESAGRKVAGPHPPRLAAIGISVLPGGQFFVDELAAIPGIAGPGDQRWAAARKPASPEAAFGEDFETLAFGQLAAGAAWRSASGPLSVLNGPSPPAGAPVAPADARNAFDGGRGSGPGQLDQPVGIALDGAGDFYIADRNNHRVQKFASDGAFLLTWGRQGDQPGEFREPHDVAADDEFVYVADTWNQRVQVFDRRGGHVFTITGEPSMNSPRGVAAAGKRVYIAEAGAGRISVYDRAGKLQQTFGTPGGDAPGHLTEPTDVAVDSRGGVWVVNGGNNRLEHFAPDGKALAPLPVPGWSGRGLKEFYLSIDRDDTLYVGDWERGQVRRFRPDGTELTPFGTDLHQPSGIALQRDRILVVSRVDDVVRVFERAGN
jgi:hypothetical protein